MQSVKWDGINVYPSKIVCIGRNFVAHADELNNPVPAEPVIFIKPNSAISDRLCAGTHDTLHFEGEITFVIHSGALAGVGFGIDLTKRALQSHLKADGLPWERAKSFDRSAVFSEFTALRGDIMALRMELYINDALVQAGGCDTMLHTPNTLLNEAKGFLSFEDGDLLMTGTPAGVGPVNRGDRYLGKILAHAQTVVTGTWVAQ